MRRLAWVGALLFPLAFFPWGCDGEANGASGGSPASGGQGAHMADGGASSQGGGAGAGGNGHGGSEDPPVYLAVTPNPRASNGDAVTPSDQITAELMTFALGVRAIHLVARWNELDPGNLSALTQRVNAYADRPLRVILELAVVDELASRRPASLAGWNDATSVANLLALVDALNAAVGSRLDAFVLGRSVDAYVEQHPNEAAALGALIEAGVARLARIAPALPRGVSLRFGAPSDLASLGNVAVYRYLPGMGEAALPSTISATNDLDTMIAQADGRPILLEVGYTSSATLASSPAQQRELLAAFFSALAPRRAAVPYVNVFQLHDVQPAPCAAYALDQGLDSGDPRVDYVCHAGLRDTQGATKPAWSETIAAAAELASP